MRVAIENCKLKNLSTFPSNMRSVPGFSDLVNNSRTDPLFNEFRFGFSDHKCFEFRFLGTGALTGRWRRPAFTEKWKKKRYWIWK